MDEQEILEQDLLVSEATPEADVLLGTIDVINVANDDAIIDIDDAFSALGEPNEQLNHSLLNGRDAADQHPITAITGLRAELDSIECMKRNLQANGRRYAQYYRWYDTNPVRANRDGYFVSLVEGTNYIKICDGTSEDVFGVIIPAPSTAFIGGVAEELVDQYGLVCFTGDVNVIRYEDVATGDCVLPNQSGIAHKSNCSGYKVIAVGNDGGTLYATINLGENGKFLSSLRSELDTIATNILNNQQSATTGINNANADIATIDTQVKSLEGSLESAQNELIALTEMVNGAYENAQNALNNAIVAQNYATASANAAIAAKNQAVAQANNAVSSVNQLAADLSPISNWEDEATGNIGAEYFVEHIQNDLGTKTEILTASTKAENALTAVSKNAKMLQSLASITKKYVVGPQSQGYGLKLSELQSTLVEGSIYVTTATHSEAYGDGYTQNFISGKSYRWSGTTWDEFKDVYMINVYRTGDTNHPLWYNTATNSITADEVVYDPETLYLWHDDIWVAVATLQESSLARVTSMIKQTADSISAEIVNARGSYASMSARLTADEAVVSQSAIWIDNNSEAIATTIQKASDNEAEIAQLTSIQTLDVVTTKRIGDTPTGTFYAQQPTWDDANQSWKFSGDASTTPSSPCYAKKSDGDKLYYHYFSIVENGETVWYRNEIGPVSYSRAGIINRVNAAESTLDSLTTWQGTTDESITNIEQTSRKDEAYINHIAAVKHYDAVSVEELSEVPTGTFYTNPPAWNANTEKWVFSGAGSTTPTSSCYGQKAANATTYYKYSKATVNDSDVWYRDEIGETSSSIAGIQQKVDDQGASIGMVVSKTESGKVINRAGIVAAINGNSNTSYVEVEADEVNFNGKTIAMSASNDLTITAGNGFRLDKNGIFWTIESNPTKMVYSQVLVAKPVDGTQYSSFPTSSASTWHKTVTALDKYASETTDSGTTWGAIRQIVGEDGTNGTSIIFKGSYPSAPSDPQNGWSYYNTTAKASYVYQGGSWYQMSIDGVNGQNGTNGISIVWKGESSTPPSNPATNWVYRNTDDSKVYIYNGTGWELMVLDGSDGQDGANGTDGNSVFITYNNNAADNAPSTPTGDGTSGGWHTNATSASVWMSQKVSSSASSGTWGTPIRIKGSDGQNGSDGINGISYYTWIKYADDANGTNMSDSPTNKTYIGLAHNKTSPTESTTASDYTWSLFKGSDGLPGTPGTDGITYYTWIKYADDASGRNMSDNPNGKTYMGIAYNKTTSTKSTTASDYSWSLIKGTDGINGTSYYFFVRYSANSDGRDMTPTPQSNTEYMGVATTTTNSAPSLYTSYTWTKIKGTDGQNGSPGTPGADGRTQYLHIKYSNDGSTFTGNSGEDVGKYIGTYVDFTQADSMNFSDYTWKKFVGEDGTSISISSTSITYQTSSSGTTTPTGTWQNTVPSVSNGQYLWTKTVVNYSDSTTTTSYSVSYKGTNGADGTSSYTHIKYSANSDGTSFVDTPTSATIYIGIYNGTLSTAPTSKTSYTWSKYHGDNGGKGDPGNGINSITYYYARTTTQTAPNAASITSTTIPTLDATNKYLWQKEVIDFTDSGVADKTTVSLIAIYGDTGSQGISVTGVIEQYCAHSSSTTAPISGWSETIPALTSSNPYMWRRQEVTYSSGNPTYTTPYLDTYIDIITGKSTDGVMTSLNNVVEYKSGDGYVLKRAGVVTAINGETAETNTKISADKIDLSGYVTISSLGSGGTTTIDGARITTGTISASRLDLSGCLTATDLSSSGSTVIDGARITTGAISAERIDSTGLSAEYIEVKDTNNDVVFKADKANKNVQIGNWAVNNNTISAGNGSVVLYGGPSSSSAGENQYKSLVDNSYSTGRIKAGTSPLININSSNITEYFDKNDGYYAFVDVGDGVFVSNNDAIDESTAYVELTAKQDMRVKFDWSCSSEENYDIFSIQIGGQSYSYSGIETGSIDYIDIASGDEIVFSYEKDEEGSDGTDKCSFYNMYIVLRDSRFQVLDDGSLYASNAKISGNIDATSGTIAGLTINSSGLASKDLSITSTGVAFTSGEMSIGNAVWFRKYSAAGKPVVIETDGSCDFILRNYYMNGNTKVAGAGIKFATTQSGSTSTITITGTGSFRNTSHGSGSKSYYTSTVYFNWTVTGGTLGNDLTIVINYKGVGSNWPAEDKTVTIKAGQSSGSALFCSDRRETQQITAMKISWTDPDGTKHTDQASYLYTTTTTIAPNNDLYCLGNFLPNTQNSCLGSNTRPWENIYSEGGRINAGTWQSSDKNIKYDIGSFTIQHDQLFDKLSPVNYKLISGTSGRTHFGLIAQDVKQAIIDSGLTTKECAIYADYEEEFMGAKCGLRYEEFIPLSIWQIQKLKKQVAEMQEEIRKLKGENHELDSSNE